MSFPGGRSFVVSPRSIRSIGRSPAHSTSRGTTTLRSFRNLLPVQRDRMTDRIVQHEAVPKCGSYEVRFPDARESTYFYFDDVPSQRLQPEMLTSEQALEQARAFERAERDKGTR